MGNIFDAEVDMELLEIGFILLFLMHLWLAAKIRLLELHIRELERDKSRGQ